MKNRFLAIFLALCMVLPLLPLVGVISLADDGVMYYDANGEIQYYNGSFVSTDRSTWGVEGQTTWIYIDHDMTILTGIAINGRVNIILKNGVTLTVGHRDGYYTGVEVSSYYNRSLTIYAQSLDKNTAGTFRGEVLGAQQYRSLGTLTINGGNIEFGPAPQGNCAGIGMYASDLNGGRGSGGTININGGFIKAYGTKYAAGIGGSNGSSVKTININGGEIEAYGGYGAPGIGTSMKCTTVNEECTVNINGGTVYACGGIGGPGIGSGFDAKNRCVVNINGGTVTAVAGPRAGSGNEENIWESYVISEPEGGAGIGAAAYTKGDTTVNITGGTVTASATNGAAIGGSQVNNGNVAVNISGGTVSATSVKGAGIGSGFNQRQNHTVAVNITGGDITAQSSEGKGIGDGLNTNETTVRLDWSDPVKDKYLANTYNANTVIAGRFSAIDEAPGRTLTDIADAEGHTILPYLSCYYITDDDSPYLEMTGCERAVFTEDSWLILADNTIYMVSGEVTYDYPILVPGSSVIYLAEDAVLNATKGIFVYKGSYQGIPGDGTLVIVAEKEDSGTLICAPLQYSDFSGAGIGGAADNNGIYECGEIQINSGTVIAQGAAGYPGIGGRNANIILNAGSVTATGGEGAPGIGGCANDTTGKATVTVGGGRIVARGGTSQQPLGLGAGTGAADTNADVILSWRHGTDSIDTIGGIGNFSIASGKEFKYLNSAPVQAASAANIKAGGVFVPHASTYYVDVNGAVQTVDDFIELSNNGSASTTLTTVDGGWYVCVNGAQNPLQIGTITVSGTMNLILTDGTEMRPVNIIVNPGATLNVYGQLAGTGVLRTLNFADGVSGIGGGTANMSCGTVNIYGGKIIAKGTKYASAIGGAGLSGSGGTINIYGGDVTATPGTDDSHGLGNGWNQNGAVINYYGGRINAGSYAGTLNFHNFFLYEDDGSRVYDDEYDPSRVIVPGLPEAAEYIDENGEEQSTYDYKRLHDDQTTLTGTYYVFEDFTFSNRLTVSGDAVLILKDGVTLNVEKGIGVNEGSSLKIYANSRDEDETGVLIAGPADNYKAAIGGDGYEATGSQNLNYQDALGSGDILIAGGKITASGGTAAAAIGAGYGHFYNLKTGGSVTITDGYVTATGNYGPGIGAGSNVTNADILISGGTVQATGGTYAAGIGATAQNNVSNTSAYSYSIEISGGTITAKGGASAITNIGTVYGNTSITVSGGQIDVSDKSNTGIGIGYSSNSVNFFANDINMSVKYSKIIGSVMLHDDFAYPDCTTATVPLAENTTLVPLTVIQNDFATVTFDPANGDAVSTVHVHLGDTLSAPADPVKEGYTFFGWFEGNGSTAFDFDAVIDFDTDLTARWEKNVYTVTFDPANGDAAFTQQVEHGEKVIAPTDPALDHATFDGWFAGGASAPFDFANTTVTAPLALTAHYTYETLTVTFHSEGGSAVSPGNVIYGETAVEPTAPTKTDFTFIGWKTANAVKFYDFGTAVTGNLDLYAVWAYLPYTTVDGSGGEYGEGHANLLDNNSATKWCKTSFNGVYVEFSTDKYIVPTGYVMTTANDTFNSPDRNPVSWKLYGRNSSSADWTQLAAVTDDETLEKANFTSYVFTLNNTASYRLFRLEIDAIKGGQGGVFQLADFLLLASAAPTAVPTCTVTFDLGEGTGTLNAMTALKGDAVTLPDGEGITPPAAKVFVGWTCGGQNYRAFDKLAVDGDVTVTARYIPYCTVSFDLGEGSGIVNSIRAPQGDTIILPDGDDVTPPTDKAFVGWSYGGKTYKPGDPFTVTGNVTVSAAYADYCTIAFVNHDSSSQEFTFVEGSVFDLPGNAFGFEPSTDGYVFAGWSDNGTLYRAGQMYTLTGDTVLTAVWGDPSEWIALQAALNALNDGDTLEYTLSGDAIAPEDADYLYVPEDTTVTIDLAGYTITRNLTQETSDGQVFRVFGDLTVCDSSANGTGIVTGGFNDGDGGGFYVHYTGSLTITGGTVTGNKAYYGGGVEANGLFIMTGGAITGNYAYYEGAGGGVEIYDFYSGITLSGSAKIYGNYYYEIDDQTHFIVPLNENNVYLYDGYYIEIGGEFTSGARIGVSTDTYPDEDNPVTFTDGLNGASASAFFADKSGFTVGVDNNGEAQLEVRTAPPAIPGDVNCDGTLNISDVTALLGVLAGGTAPGECDITGDGSLNIGDVTALLGMLAQN